jgi:type IV pilus assembly protein PilC
MANTYAYKVRDRTGRMVEGTLEAESTPVVANKLRQMGYVPIAIDKKHSITLPTELHLPGMSGRVKVKEVAVFSRQFATMINSGLTLLRSLQILSDQTDNPVLSGTIDTVRQDVENGASLSQALAKHPKVFSQLYVAMVKAGEAGGMLDQVLLQLSSTIEKQVELRAKILSAMLLFVVPLFKTLYKTLGGVLPLPTRILITASGTLVKALPFLILLLVGGIFGSKKWIATEGGRATWDKMKLKAPVFGTLVHKTALARFTRTLGVLLRSGVPILESLDITADTVGNSVVAAGCRDVQAGVRAGEPIGGRLEKHPVFPPMVVQMMAVGEETGALDALLEKVAEFYDQEVEATVDALTSLLEPLLMCILGISVGSMVISLYLPMFDIIKLVK